MAVCILFQAIVVVHHCSLNLLALYHAFTELQELILKMCHSSKTAEGCRMQACPHLTESSTLHQSPE